MIIDPTTINNVYNPIGPQGQWIKHRWGKRNFPQIDIKLEKVMHTLDAMSEGFFIFNHPIYCKSTFGDAMLWEHITRISKIVGSRLTVTTYGMIDVKVAETVKRHQSMIHFFIDGYRDECGRVFLGAEWSTISYVLNKVRENAMVEFFVYEHNKHQIPSMVRFCAKRNIKLKFTTGISNDPIGSCIIDQQGNWLYDVVPYELDTDMFEPEVHTHLKEKFKNAEPVALKRHLENYNSLRTYIKEVEGRSLLDSPIVSNSNKEDLIEKFSNDQVEYHLAPTGHITESSEEFSMFVNMLCDDWLLDSPSVYKMDTSNEYMLSMLYYAQKFDKDYLKNREVLSYFTES